MNVGTLTAFLSLDKGNFTQGLNSTVQEMNRANTAVEQMESKFAGVAKALVAVYAGSRMVQMAKEATMLAARYETLGVAMYTVGQNAGHTVSELNAQQKALEKTGITMTESRSNITKLIQSEINLKDATKLARIAQDAAVIGHTNSSEAFARMIHGIRSGETEILKNIGLNIQADVANKKYAETLGTIPSRLDKQQRMQAMVNAVFDEGTKIQGTYQNSLDTVGKKIQSLARPIEDVQVLLGNMFLPITATGVDALTEFFVNMKTWIVENKKELDEWGKRISIFADLLKNLVIVFGTLWATTLVFKAGTLIWAGLTAAVAAYQGSIVSLNLSMLVLENTTTMLMKSAGLLVIAFTTGFAIGKWLSDNFLWAKEAGIGFVDATIKAFLWLKKVGQEVWEFIKLAMQPIIAALGMIITATGEFISLVPGLGLVGKSLQDIGRAMVESTNGSGSKYAERIKVINDEHEKSVGLHNKNIQALYDSAAATHNTTNATSKFSDEQAKANKLKKEAADRALAAAKAQGEYKKAIDDAAKSLKIQTDAMVELELAKIESNANLLLAATGGTPKSYELASSEQQRIIDAAVEQTQKLLSSVYGVVTTEGRIAFSELQDSLSSVGRFIDEKAKDANSQLAAMDQLENDRLLTLTEREQSENRIRQHFIVARQNARVAGETETGKIIQGLYAAESKTLSELNNKDAFEKIRLYSEMYKELDDQSGKYYEMQVKLLDEDIRLRKVKLGDSVEVQLALEAYKNKRLQELRDQSLMKNGSFIDGMVIQWKKLLEQQTTVAQLGGKIMLQAYGDMRKGFSDLFYDGITGDLKSLGSYFDDLWKNILRSFADFLAEMVAMWAANAVISWLSGGKMGVSFGGSVGGKGGGISIGDVSTGVSTASTVYTGWTAAQAGATTTETLAVMFPKIAKLIGEDALLTSGTAKIAEMAAQKAAQEAVAGLLGEDLAYTASVQAAQQAAAQEALTGLAGEGAAAGSSTGATALSAISSWMPIIGAAVYMIGEASRASSPSVTWGDKFTGARGLDPNLTYTPDVGGDAYAQNVARPFLSGMDKARALIVRDAMTTAEKLGVAWDAEKFSGATSAFEQGRGINELLSPRWRRAPTTSDNAPLVQDEAKWAKQMGYTVTDPSGETNVGLWWDKGGYARMLEDFNEKLEQEVLDSLSQDFDTKTISQGITDALVSSSGQGIMDAVQALDTTLGPLPEALWGIVPPALGATQAAYDAATGILTLGNAEGDLLGYTIAAKDGTVELVSAISGQAEASDRLRGGIEALSEQGDITSESLSALLTNLGLQKDGNDALAKAGVDAVTEMQAIYGDGGAFGLLGDATSWLTSHLLGKAAEIAAAAEEAGSFTRDLIAGGAPVAHADGGIFTRPTLLGRHLVAEAGRPEAILPLPEGPRTMDRIIERLDRIERSSNRPVNVTVNVAGKEFYADVAQIADAVRVEATRRNAGMRAVA